MMDDRSLHFLDQPVQVLFDDLPVHEKTPDCPNGFIWDTKTYRVVELISSWSDFTRHGKAARNTPAQNRRCWVRQSHAEVASGRGSLNVGRFFFRVRVDTGQAFDLYYDRAMKSVDERKGQWFLYRELAT
jgi:uncharacterized protein DUF6504